MNTNAVLHVLEKSPNLQSLAGVEGVLRTFSALLLEQDSYSIQRTYNLQQKQLV